MADYHHDDLLRTDPRVIEMNHVTADRDQKLQTLLSKSESLQRKTSDFVKCEPKREQGSFRRLCCCYFNEDEYCHEDDPIDS